jgi:S1-C subfamily serine protease
MVPFLRSKRKLSEKKLDRKAIRITIIAHALFLTATFAYGQKPKMTLEKTRDEQATSAQDTYVITKHASVPSSEGGNRRDEQYTIVHGAEILKVRYVESQTSNVRPGDFPLQGQTLHLHSTFSNPDLSQIPPVGVAIRACLTREDSIAVQPTPAPCMVRLPEDGVEYVPSPNSGDFAYVKFDILSETTKPSTATRAQSAPPRKDIPAISREANGAVVSIVMSDKDGHPIAQGSGFLISKDGHVVTNYHVIKSGTSAIIKLPDGAFFAVDGVLASDKTRDVAIIKVHGNNFRTLTLGDSDRLQVGQEVVAIGNPLSLESTVSNGIVSAIRTIEDEGGKFVQITAPISPGSSGGPLFNMAGEVVGITTSHLKGGENLNFAIPINDARPLLGVPASQALLALPNEPEAAAVMPEASAPANPLLGEVQQWMKDNVNPASWSSQALTLFTDSGRIVKPESFEGCYGFLDCTRLYAVESDFAVNVRDGKSRNWQRNTQAYDLKFEGCSMAVDDFEAVSKSIGERPDADARDKWKFNGTDTFDLSHYDPRVTVQEDLTTHDAFDSQTGKLKVIKGTKYFDEVAWVRANSLSHYHERAIQFYLSYPFAERFAKALEHAITLCGGKPESF